MARCSAAAESEFVRTGGRQIPDQDEFFWGFCLAKLRFVCFAEPKNPALVFVLIRDKSKRQIFLFAGRSRKPELAVEQPGFPRARRRHKNPQRS